LLNYTPKNKPAKTHSLPYSRFIEGEGMSKQSKSALVYQYTNLTQIDQCWTHMTVFKEAAQVIIFTPSLQTKLYNPKKR